MKYNYKYGILFKFNPCMDVILNKPFGYSVILDLLYNNTRDYKKGDIINFTYNKGNNKRIIQWFNNKGYKINLMEQI